MIRCAITGTSAMSHDDHGVSAIGPSLGTGMFIATVSPDHRERLTLPEGMVQVIAKAPSGYVSPQQVTTKIVCER